MKKLFFKWVDKQKKLSTWVKRGLSLLVLFYIYYFEVDVKNYFFNILDFCLTNRTEIAGILFKISAIIIVFLFSIFFIVFVVAYFTIGFEGIEKKIDEGESLIIKIFLFILKKASPF